ncbi:uncharacterized protein LOC127777792 [Oryza glaberrima]|nr:uncharacterized protein LOC127777792 [Oryza glaberrima]
MMASSRAALLVAVLLLLLVSSLSVRAEADQVARAPALAPDVAAASWVQQGSQEAAAPGRPGMGMGKNGAARWRRTAGRRGRGGGGGTGAWAFSAMLPRGFVPPSGSSACHNDMPAAAADAEFFVCGGGDGSP